MQVEGEEEWAGPVVGWGELRWRERCKEVKRASGGRGKREERGERDTKGEP